MSDSIDRVFVHALATVRRLPRTGSSRPPPNARLKLYGLYKQSMEGDVAAILPRPILPPSSPESPLNDATDVFAGNQSRSVNRGDGHNNGTATTAVHRYASRDLRTREAQAEIEKWDSWHECAGLSRTEAKRRYISTLIETMKEYASGTSESRELVGELEFVWEQVKNQSGSGSDPDPETEDRGRDGNADTSGDGDSPGRKRERAGLGRRNESFQTAIASINVARSSDVDASAPTSRGRQKPRRTASGMRVLSPVDQSAEDDNDEADRVMEQVREGEHSPQTGTGTGRGSPSVPRTSQFLPSTAAHNINVDRSGSVTSDFVIQNLAQWQRMLEHQIHHLTTEVAALREQLSANHLLRTSTYSHTYYALSRRGKIVHQFTMVLRRLASFFAAQLQAQVVLLVVLIVYGRFTNDARVEEWLKVQLGKFRRKSEGFVRTLGGLLLNLLSRDGWMEWLRKLFWWTRLV